MCILYLLNSVGGDCGVADRNAKVLVDQSIYLHSHTASGVNIGRKIVIMHAYGDLRSHKVSNYIVMKT